MTKFIEILSQVLGYFALIVGLMQFLLLFGYGLVEYLKLFRFEKGSRNKRKGSDEV